MLQVHAQPGANAVALWLANLGAGWCLLHFDPVGAYVRQSRSEGMQGMAYQVLLHAKLGT